MRTDYLLFVLRMNTRHLCCRLVGHRFSTYGMIVLWRGVFCVEQVCPRCWSRRYVAHATWETVDQVRPSEYPVWGSDG